MPITTSRRERFLWLCAVVVLAILYTSVPFAASWVGALDQQALSLLFSAGMLMVLVALLALGLSLRVRGVEIAVVIGLVAVAAIVLARYASPAERSHLIEYSVVGGLVYEALLERHCNTGRPRWPGLVALVATVVLGLLDEGLQSLVPSRVFDPFDLLFNTLAALLAVAAIGTLRWMRRRWQPVREE